MLYCYKKRLVLQFHITGNCNLRCKHCYRTEGDAEPLSYEDIISVLEQFKVLKEQYNSFHGIEWKGHINLTGGEPFYRKDIKKILSYLGKNRKHFTYGILSNGSFIDSDMIKILKDTGVTFVQLSIDGNKEIHDSLRAHGDYDRVMQTAEMLEKNNIKTQVSFTANKMNFHCLPHVAKECRKRKISKLWSDRLVPIGNGEELKKLAITWKDMPSYIEQLKKAQGNHISRFLHPETTVAMNRALQFQNSHGKIYSCSAGNSLITVDEFGNIMPCRRMPIICGNIYNESLSDVYFNNDIFSHLQTENIPEECINCEHAYLCKGGARCQSYALYGSFYKADPACPIIHKIN